MVNSIWYVIFEKNVFKCLNFNLFLIKQYGIYSTQ